jgi:hypothetical protein
MFEQTKTRESGAREFSDSKLRQFLLAQLVGATQTEFEAALFSDPHLEKRLRLAELKLVDDYASDHLTAKQRRLFREKFLVSSERRIVLDVSTDLCEQFDLPHSLPHASTSRAIFVLRNPVWRFAFASVILVLVLASVWLVTKEPQLVRQIIPRRLRPTAVSTPTPEVAHHRTDSGVLPAHQDEPSQSPEHEAGAQTVLLRQSKDAPTTVTLSSSTVSVRIELEVQHPAQSGYRAEVVTNSSEVVFSTTQVLANDRADRISFECPANILRGGDFQIRLTQLADSGAVTTYDFRVQ